ncbi:MAG: tetratricopeptide repeat protein [Planctomycetota bacterium]
MKMYLTGVGFAAALACGVASAAPADDADIREALRKSVQVEFSGKTTAEAVKTLCGAVGVEAGVEAATAENDSSGRGGTRGEMGLDGRNSGMLSCYRWNGRVVGYSLKMTASFPLENILDKLCANEGLTWRVEDGRIKMAPAEKSPFDLKRFMTSGAVPIRPGTETDWRRAVKDICVARENSGNIPKGFWSTPQEYRLARAVAGLEGHPEEDAVRIWFVGELAFSLWGSRPMEKNGYVVAAAREAIQLMRTPAVDRNLSELASVLRPYYPLAGDVPDRNLLLLKVHDASYAAVLNAGEREAAVALVKELAYGHAKICCPRYFDLYHRAIAGQAGFMWKQIDHADEWLAAAREDMAYAEKAYKPGSPGLPSFHYLLAKACAASRQYAEAAEHYEKALKLDSEMGGFQDERPVLTESQRVMGNDGMRTVTRERGAPSLPGRIQVVLAWAETLEKAGQPERAAVVLREELKKSPAETQLLATLAKLYEGMGEGGKAKTAWREVLEQAPERNFLRVGAEYALKRLERNADSSRAQKTPVPTDVPKPNPARQVEEGWKAFHAELDGLVEKQRFDEALKKVQDAAGRFPDHERERLRSEAFFLDWLGKETEAAERKAAADDLFREPQSKPWQPVVARMKADDVRRIAAEEVEREGIPIRKKEKDNISFDKGIWKVRLDEEVTVEVNRETGGIRVNGVEIPAEETAKIPLAGPLDAADLARRTVAKQGISIRQGNRGIRPTSSGWVITFYREVAVDVDDATGKATVRTDVSTDSPDGGRGRRTVPKTP